MDWLVQLTRIVGLINQKSSDELSALIHSTRFVETINPICPINDPSESNQLIHSNRWFEPTKPIDPINSINDPN